MRSPIQWFGGKGNFTKKIVPILNNIQHKFYCEPFGGSALQHAKRIESVWIKEADKRQARLL